MSQPQNRALLFWKMVHEICLDQQLDDISMRQMAILLKVYLDTPPHTVKSLSESLNIPKAAVSRAIDSLSTKQLLRRERSKYDKRSVIIQRTIMGMTCLTTVSDAITRASGQLKEQKTDAA